MVPAADDPVGAAVLPTEPSETTTVVVDAKGLTVPFYPIGHVGVRAYDDWRFVMRAGLQDTAGTARLLDRVDDSNFLDADLLGASESEKACSRKVYSALVKAMLGRGTTASRLLTMIRSRVAMGNGGHILRLLDSQCRRDEQRLKDEAVEDLLNLAPRNDFRAYIAEIELLQQTAQLPDSAVLLMLKRNVPRNLKYVQAAWEQSSDPTYSNLIEALERVISENEDSRQTPALHPTYERKPKGKGKGKKGNPKGPGQKDTGKDDSHKDGKKGKKGGGKPKGDRKGKGNGKGKWKDKNAPLNAPPGGKGGDSSLHTAETGFYDRFAWMYDEIAYVSVCEDLTPALDTNPQAERLVETGQSTGASERPLDESSGKEIEDKAPGQWNPTPAERQADTGLITGVPPSTTARRPTAAGASSAEFSQSFSEFARAWQRGRQPQGGILQGILLDSHIECLQRDSEENCDCDFLTRAYDTIDDPKATDEIGDHEQRDEIDDCEQRDKIDDCEEARATGEIGDPKATDTIGDKATDTIGDQATDTIGDHTQSDTIDCEQRDAIDDCKQRAESDDCSQEAPEMYFIGDDEDEICVSYNADGICVSDLPGLQYYYPRSIPKPACALVCLFLAGAIGNWQAADFFMNWPMPTQPTGDPFAESWEPNHYCVSCQGEIGATPFEQFGHGPLHYGCCDSENSEQIFVFESGKNEAIRRHNRRRKTREHHERWEQKRDKKKTSDRPKKKKKRCVKRVVPSDFDPYDYAYLFNAMDPSEEPALVFEPFSHGTLQAPGQLNPTPAERQEETGLITGERDCDYSRDADEIGSSYADEIGSHDADEIGRGNADEIGSGDTDEIGDRAFVTAADADERFAWRNHAQTATSNFVTANELETWLLDNAASRHTVPGPNTQEGPQTSVNTSNGKAIGSIVEADIPIAGVSAGCLRMPKAPRLLSIPQLKHNQGYTLVEGPECTYLVPPGVNVTIEDETKCIKVTQSGDGLNRIYYDRARGKVVDATWQGQWGATIAYNLTELDKEESYAAEIGHPLPKRDPTCLACKGKHRAHTCKRASKNEATKAEHDFLPTIPKEDKKQTRSEVNKDSNCAACNGKKRPHTCGKQTLPEVMPEQEMAPPAEPEQVNQEAQPEKQAKKVCFEPQPRQRQADRLDWLDRGGIGDDDGGYHSLCHTPPRDDCETCMAAKHLPKQHRRKKPGEQDLNEKFQLTRPFEMIACDTQGPITSSREGMKYVFTAICYHTNYTLAKPMRNDTAAMTAETYREHLGHHPVRICRHDNGHEFVGSEFQETLRDYKVSSKESQPHTPQSNHKIERYHRDLNAGTRALLFAAGAPRNVFWADALEYWNYCRNRTVTGKDGKTPYENLTKSKFPATDLHPWGSLVYYSVTDHNLAKLGRGDKYAPKGLPGILLGRHSNQAWKVADLGELRDSGRLRIRITPNARALKPYRYPLREDPLLKNRLDPALLVQDNPFATCETCQKPVMHDQPTTCAACSKMHTKHDNTIGCKYGRCLCSEGQGEHDGGAKRAPPTPEEANLPAALQSGDNADEIGDNSGSGNDSEPAMPAAASGDGAAAPGTGATADASGDGATAAGASGGATPTRQTEYYNIATPGGDPSPAPSPGTPGGETAMPQKEDDKEKYRYMPFGINPISFATEREREEEESYVTRVVDPRSERASCEKAKAAQAKEFRKFLTDRAFTMKGDKIVVAEKATVIKSDPCATFVKMKMLTSDIHVEKGEADPAMKGRIVMQGCVQQNQHGQLVRLKEKGAVEQLYSDPVSQEDLRVALTIAASKGLCTAQVADLSNAYLKSNLRGDAVYATITKNMFHLFSAHMSEDIGQMYEPVVKIEKACYGLVRSGHDFEAWRNSVLRGLNWTQHKTIKSIFSRNGTYIVCYVDDLLLLTKSSKHAEKIWTELRQKAGWEFKEEPKSASQGYLGMKICFENNDGWAHLCISQKEYAEHILNKFLEDTGVDPKKVKKPSAPMTATSPSGIAGKLGDVARKHLGALMHLARCTRPDIQMATSCIASAVGDDWDTEHDKVLTQLVYYVGATSELVWNAWIKIGDSDTSRTWTLRADFDSDLAGCKLTRKSRTGVALVMIDDMGSCSYIGWSSQRQSSIAHSSGESEISGLAAKVHRAIRVQQVVEDLAGELPWCECGTDAQASKDAIAKGYSVKMCYLERYRGINIAWLNELFYGGNMKRLTLAKRDTAVNLGDPHTKPLVGEQFRVHRHAMGVYKPATRWDAPSQANSQVCETVCLCAEQDAPLWLLMPRELSGERNLDFDYIDRSREAEFHRLAKIERSKIGEYWTPPTPSQNWLKQQRWQHFKKNGPKLKKGGETAEWVRDVPVFGDLLKETQEEIRARGLARLDEQSVHDRKRIVGHVVDYWNSSHDVRLAPRPGRERSRSPIVYTAKRTKLFLIDCAFTRSDVLPPGMTDTSGPERANYRWVTGHEPPRNVLGDAELERVKAHRDAWREESCNKKGKVLNKVELEQEYVRDKRVRPLSARDSNYSEIHKVYSACFIKRIVHGPDMRDKINDADIKGRQKRKLALSADGLSSVGKNSDANDIREAALRTRKGAAGLARGSSGNKLNRQRKDAARRERKKQPLSLYDSDVDSDVHVLRDPRTFMPPARQQGLKLSTRNDVKFFDLEKAEDRLHEEDDYHPSYDRKKREREESESYESAYNAYARSQQQKRKLPQDAGDRVKPLRSIETASGFADNRDHESSWDLAAAGWDSEEDPIEQARVSVSDRVDEIESGYSDKRVSGKRNLPFCPNKSNRFHKCSDFCFRQYGPKTARLTAARLRPKG